MIKIGTFISLHSLIVATTVTKFVVFHLSESWQSGVAFLIAIYDSGEVFTGIQAQLNLNFVKFLRYFLLSHPHI